MKQIEELKEENIKLKEKIKQNEEIDDELDKLLIDNKDIINKGNKNNKSVNFKDLKLNKFNKCLNLINAVKMKNIEIDRLKIENKELNNNLEMLNEQCNAYKNISDKINQPYSYLVKSLQDKDLEKIQLNKIILNKEENINKLKLQCETYENKINLLQNMSSGEKLDNSKTNINRLNYFINNFNKSISLVNSNNFEQ